MHGQRHPRCTVSELSINSEALQSGFGTLFGNFVDSAFLLADPARRLFWLSILSSLVIAIIVLRLQGRPLSLKFLRRVFLSRKYWLNPSSRIDFRYFLLNSGIKAVLLTLFVSAQLAVTIAVAMILQKNLGTATPTALPWLAVACLYTFVFFVAEDLSRFLLHVGMHKLPFLWRFHRVHHSATTLTPLTLHR